MSEAANGTVTRQEREGRARYRRILRFAAHHLAVSWWYELFLPRVGLRVIAERTRTRRMVRIARAFHGLALDLGGLMIKVGQFMSSRLDVLPPEITRELEGLQDEVPPVPFAEIRAIAEAQLGVPLERVFASIDEVPVAAASLGQAHRAVLQEGDAELAGFAHAVLKVQRPGIAAIVTIDLAALRRVGRWLSQVRLVSRRVDMPALVEEFATTSREEIDYLHEAAAAERFAENFAADKRVAVPRIAWERTSTRVLTLEDVTAIKISDTVRLRAAGIDPAAVADAFASVMFDQLFTHGYFHADPHPGNIFVSLRGSEIGSTNGESSAPPEWQLTFIDFGMMGEVPPELRRGLRAVLLAAAARNGPGLVAAMRDIGVLLPAADTGELERAMSQLFDRFGGMGFAELREVDQREFREFATQFGDVIRALPFQLPENFLLIVRALSLTSGVCSTLNPAFNLWNSVEPYAAQLLKDERSGMISDAVSQLGGVLGSLWRLPGRVEQLVTRMDTAESGVMSPQLGRRRDRLDRVGQRLTLAVLGAGLLLSGAVLRADDPVLGTLLLVVAVPFGIGALLPRRG